VRLRPQHKLLSLYLAFHSLLFHHVQVTAIEPIKHFGNTNPPETIFLMQKITSFEGGKFPLLLVIVYCRYFASLYLAYIR